MKIVGLNSSWVMVTLLRPTFLKGRAHEIQSLHSVHLVSTEEMDSEKGTKTQKHTGRVIDRQKEKNQMHRETVERERHTQTSQGNSLMNERQQYRERKKPTDTETDERIGTSVTIDRKDG